MEHDETDSTETPGSLPQEKVEDRSGVSVVKPEDYPGADRNGSTPRPLNPPA
jgi:hypothetical protein